MNLRIGALLLLTFLSASPAAAAPAGHRFDGRPLESGEIDQAARSLLARSRVPGLAVAVIDDGRVAFVGAYGQRDVAKDLPLQTDTVMYGASLTKLAFAWMVAQLADEGVVDLDAPISRDLKRPLPEYEAYRNLAGDERWKKLTPRILLGHASGFANFAFLEPDEKLRFHFEPGERYAYSGEGFNLLQFVLEEGLGLDVGAEMQRRVFEPFGMTRTSMTWRDDFASNMTTGYDAEGKRTGHRMRARTRAAGSMDTTIADYARFAAALVTGEGLGSKGRAAMARTVVPIRSAHQFPTLDPATNSANARLRFAGGLGHVRFTTRHGPALMKGGHDDQTDNLLVCVRRRCILILTNSGVGARLFPALVDATVGDPGIPWGWEYNPRLPLEP